MNQDDPLLRILACPLDKGPLHLLEKETENPDSTEGAEGAEGAESAERTEDALYNPRLRRRYPIVDGIPQLLPSSGEQVTDHEHEELLLRITGGSPGSPPAARATQTPGTMTP